MILRALRGFKLFVSVGKNPASPLAALACLLALPCSAQITQLCQPIVSAPITVVSAQQRKAAGEKAIPPITDKQNGFAWPDSEFGVTQTNSGLAFFASDGAHHDRNNKYGSVVRTLGDLDNPLGSAPPIDVIIHPNPDPSVNPNYSAYTYLGGGRIFRVPGGQPGAGNLLNVYHAEINTETSFYSLLGLAVSLNDGLYWTDLGEIIRLNQPYKPELGGFDIGSPQMIASPDGQFFYIYFPDWIDNGSLPPSKVTKISVARASMAEIFAAAFSNHPHAAKFQKYYQGAWDQPGIGGLSTDLNPNAGYAGSNNVAFSSALNRYVLITDDTEHIAYAESQDGIAWTLPVLLGQDADYGPTSYDYATPLGTGDDPNTLGDPFYVFFTHGSPQGWPGNTVDRFTVTCK